MKRSRAAVFVAVALMGAGCSHGKNESQGGSPTAAGTLYGSTVTAAANVAGPKLTKQQFATKADAICERYLAEEARLPGPVTKAENVRGARQAARLFGRQRAELAAAYRGSESRGYMALESAASRAGLRTH